MAAVSSVPVEAAWSHIKGTRRTIDIWTTSARLGSYISESAGGEWQRRGESDKERIITAVLDKQGD